jgi:hypothetical protein
MSDKSISRIVAKYAHILGLGDIAPHDLRRTFAMLARSGGAELEQIQLSLGHASIATTERYLGTKQSMVDAPCDRLVQIHHEDRVVSGITRTGGYCSGGRLESHHSFIISAMLTRHCDPIGALIALVTVPFPPVSTRMAYLAVPCIPLLNYFIPAE